MRVILIACYASIDAKEDAMLLRARGFDAATLFDMYAPTHRFNLGTPANDRAAWHNLAVELMEGATPVLHTDHKPDLAARIANLCHALQVPLLLPEDLPFIAYDKPAGALEQMDRSQHYRQQPTAGLPAHTPAAYTLGDQLRAWRDRILRWEAWLNQHLSGLKNPRSAMAQQQQQPPPRPYRIPDHPVTTTG